MKINSVLKCEKCGGIVEVVSEETTKLPNCCNQTMILLPEKTMDSSTEKHVPYIEVNGNEVIVRIGENQEHPMQENHYINWIELIIDNSLILRKQLKPGQLPETKFEITKFKNLKAREYCNLHGLWINKLN